MTTTEYNKYLDEITRQLKITFEYNPFLLANEKKRMATPEYIYNRYKVKLKPEQIEKLNNLLDKQEKRAETQRQKKIKHHKRKKPTTEEINAHNKKVDKEIKAYNNAIKKIEHLKEELKKPMNKEQEEIIKRQLKTLNAYIKNEQIKMIDGENKKPLYIKKIQANIIDPLNTYNMRNHHKKIDPYKIICII